LKRKHLEIICAIHLMLLNSFNINAQDLSNLPVIKAKNKSISIRDGKKFRPASWTISPELKPDVYQSDIKSKSQIVTFITDIDSISFAVKSGNVYRFVVLLNNKDSALTEIRGVPFVEPAVFSKKYIKAHDKKTTTEIPEVYELVNIVFALTPSHKNVSWADEKKSDYYQKVMSHFDKFSNDPFVAKIDTLLKRNMYSRMKMDAYAFEFDSNGKIVKGQVYDRVSWGKVNTLKDLIGGFQAFSDKTGFRKFYSSQRPFYDAQIRGYRDSFNVAEMVRWLNKNFPKTRYNTFKIIWSPLVGGNQSANWFENNGFKEAHAHVNYPFAYYYTSGSEEAKNLRRGNIVFTEINHAYINPEGEKYTDQIIKAFPDKYKWAIKGKPSDGYGNGPNLFNEYMNWGLVSLRYIDYAPADEVDSLLARNERYMADGRGFPMFPQFNKFLVATYKARKPNETLADLFPAIVRWFDENK
jgi:hypothetical protein